MATVENVDEEISNQGMGMESPLEEAEKHAQYTDEQIEILEKVYPECPNPSRSQRLQIMREHPILNGIEDKKLKIWFRNSRRREKQKKEEEEFRSLNQKLFAINNLLAEENNLLQTEVDRMVNEIENLKNQIMQLPAITTEDDPDNEPEADPPLESDSTTDSDRSILLRAAKSMTQSLSRATETAGYWIPVPKLMVLTFAMLFGVFLSVSNQLFTFQLPGAGYDSHNCVQLAARESNVIPTDAIEKIKILTDCSLWFPNCQNLEVPDKFLVNYGTTIGFVYKQEFLFIGHFVNNMNDGKTCAYGMEPSNLGYFSQKLSRGFDDAIHCFTEDGWSLMNGSDVSDDLKIYIKHDNNLGGDTNHDTVHVKTSMLLQNIFRELPVNRIREHDFESMDFNFDARSAAFLKAVSVAFSGLNTHLVAESTVLHGNAINGNKLIQLCLYANQSGFYMLHRTPKNLQDLDVDKILDDSSNISLRYDTPMIMQQGYATLPPGYSSILNESVRLI